jgi:hypothetical protein
LRRWIARMPTRERQRQVDLERLVSAINRSYPRAVERLEVRVNALGTHVTALDGTRVFAFAQRLQPFTPQFCGARPR